MSTSKPESAPPNTANAPDVICPACAKSTRYSTSNPYRPFCSERCKVIDLGAWANEEYRIAGTPQDVSSDDPEADLI